jgi:chorismate synthase
MAGSSFGTLFRISTFGESHGGAVGVILDGAPPGLALSEQDIQKELDRRKPGQSAVTTPRKETDQVHILSGLFEGRTTGTPLLMILYNQDQQPEAYAEIKDLFRPGHADFTYLNKYGLRDHRGSGRASGRETAGRVAAGAVAKKILKDKGITITAYTLRAAGVSCGKIDTTVIESNPMRAADLEAAGEMERRVIDLAAQGDSVGGIVECRIDGLPPGLGEPVFDKFEADLAKAILSLGGVKGIEFGTGFGCVDMKGSEHNDAMGAEGFKTNHAGGTLGGITTGEPVIFRSAVKPTSSIEKTQDTVDIRGNERKIETRGRHDPCLCPRIVPVMEAMAALVTVDHLMRQEILKSNSR